MRVVRLKSMRDFEEWREAARALLLAGVRPDDVAWAEGDAGDLFAAPEETVTGVSERAVGRVPRRFLDLARVAFFHDEPRRLGLLYRLLFRLQKDNELLAARSDPDVSLLYRLVTDIRQDVMRSKTEAGERLRAVARGAVSSEKPVTGPELWHGPSGPPEVA